MNRVILITGASRGIGRATAYEFAKQKDIICINYHTSTKQALELKAQLENELKVEAEIFKADISQEDKVQNMVEEIISRYGRIDVLVNNAGIDIPDEFENHTPSNFQKVLNTNLLGTFIVSKLVSKYMLDEKKGVIINVSSNNALGCNSPVSLDYDASKAGVNSLTYNLADALAPYVRVNAVAPGWTNTDAVLEMFEEYKEEEKKKILLERFAEPQEIAKVIVFLASDDASYINKEIIRIDGGIR